MANSEEFWRWFDRLARADFAGTLIGLLVDWRPWVPTVGAFLISFFWASAENKSVLDVFVTALVVAACVAVLTIAILLVIQAARNHGAAKTQIGAEVTATAAEQAPDLNAAEAFIVTRNLHAKEKLDRDIHDSLALGKLRAWGRVSSDRPWTLIKPDEWNQIELEFDERTLTSVPPNVCAFRRDRRTVRGSTIAYVHVHFSRSEFFANFPLSEAIVGLSIEERKDLIFKARKFASRALGTPSIDDQQFRKKLEADISFIRLKPYFSVGALQNIFGPGLLFVPNDGTQMPISAKAFLQELERLEKVWGLLDG